MAGINKLSDTAFRNIEPINKEQLLADGGGLYVRVRSIEDGGAVSFRLTFRIERKQKWLTLGTYPTMTLKGARNARDVNKAKISDGLDPALGKQLDKERNRQQQLSEKAELSAIENRITVNALFDRWQLLEICNRKDKGKEVRRLFEKDVLPHIGQLAVEDVKKSHVIAVVDKLLERGVDRLAKITLSLLRQMFRFAIDRDIIEADPTATIRKSKIGKPDTIRERYLSDDEIRELSQKLADADLIKSTECAIWIALATGCRIGELLKTKWEDVDLENGTWLIQSENSKNGESLTVYLSAFSINQFKTLNALSGSSLWCYPNRTGKSHVCEKTVTKQIADRQLSDSRKPMSHRSKNANSLELSGGPWRPHDLRRTAGTLMIALGILPDIADRCLNHKEQNRIRRVYFRHNYEVEKQQAWHLLGERLELLYRTDIPNVLTLKPKAA